MSHVLTVRMVYKAFSSCKVTSFGSDIYHEKLIFVKSGHEVVLTIRGLRTEEKKLELLRAVLNVLYVYLGAFPDIEHIIYDDKEIDSSNWVLKYNTRSDFKRSDLILCSIDSTTINESVLRALGTIPEMPLYSLQYLVSEAYKHMISDHKITLLLHVIDGMVQKAESTKGESDWKKKYQNRVQGKIGNYRPSVHYLCSRYFYKYHRKYNCEILKLLKENQFSFVETITDTRNWYSHFLEKGKKLNRMHDGVEMQIYFEIIYYTLRLMCLDRLGVLPDEAMIREFFYTVHDWILEIMYDRKDNLKSQTYRSIQSYQEFLSIINSYEESTDG